jgi:RNA polymerase sigma-70 factor, ECF subfamily
MPIAPQPRTISVALSEQIPGSIAGSTAGPSVNQDAFRVFYSRTSRSLWAYLLRISRRPDVADDLLQESYCRFLAASLPQMDAADSRSYLFKIATNLLRDRWRRKETSDRVDTPKQFSNDDPETRTDVRRAFDQLRPRERQLLWLAHVEGFDHREIAGLMGLKVASVRVLLFRARRELAGALCERPRNRSGA